MQGLAPSRPKDIPLEAIRGLAAITVVVWHAMLGFFPGLSGNFPAELGDGWAGQPWFGLVNGLAAVNLFFVLSGYVLTRAYLLTGDASIITRGALKRWPRLAGPVVIAVLASYLLWKLNLYRFNEAAAVTHSPWLANHLFNGDPVFPSRFLDGLAQGLFFTFFRADASYFDSSLWTMRWEFAGSFLSFGLALIVRPMGVRHRALILTVAMLLSHFWSPQLASFTLGVGLAALLPATTRTRGVGLTIAGFVIGIYLAGYQSREVGAYAWMHRALGDGVPPSYVQSIGAALIIAVVEIASFGRSLLSGKIAAFLGRLSFPLYLVHIPILCSFGSMALLATGQGKIGALTTLALSFAAAIPLMWFNEAWVRALNRRFSANDAQRTAQTTRSE